MNRILLVDDNEIFIRGMAQALRSKGYEVQTAPEGGAALQLATQQHFDLVVTDLVMPGKEGLQTIIELRQLQRDLKIIAISGGGRGDAQDYLEMASRLGAVKTLAKPFRLPEVLELIEAALASQTGAG